MVVFTCNHCGESLHKPKVEKHFQFACRNNSVSLTCVDCFKDFKGDEFKVHTKCITEDERYSAKGTFVNGDVKKGEVKQESWVEMIRSILDKDLNLTSAQKGLLETISTYNNVPRKKAKFLNFIKSSSGGRTNLKEAEDVWNIIEKYKNEQSKASHNGNHNSVNEEIKVIELENKICKSKKQEVPKKKKKKAQLKAENEETVSVEKQNKNVVNEEKKRKIEENSEEKPRKKKKKQNDESTQDENENVSPEVVKNGDDIETGKFNFTDKIVEILNKKKTISLKKLQKKTLNAYLKSTGEAECSEKIIKKYNKKLKKLNNIEIDENNVTLTS